MHLNNLTSLWTACRSEINPKEQANEEKPLLVKTDNSLRADLVNSQTVLQILPLLSSLDIHQSHLFKEFSESWMRGDPLSFFRLSLLLESKHQRQSWVMKGLPEPLTTSSLALRDKKNDRLKYHYEPKLQVQTVSIFARNYSVWSKWSKLEHYNPSHHSVM